MKFAALFLPVMALLVAGCDNEPESAIQADDPDRRAEGEISGGTISDAMLPLDTVRSQAPLDRQTGNGETGSATGPAGAGAVPAEADQPAGDVAATDEAAQDPESPERGTLEDSE